jgi:hypothetical protein
MDRTCWYKPLTYSGTLNLLRIAIRRFPGDVLALCCEYACQVPVVIYCDHKRLFWYSSCSHGQIRLNQPLRAMDLCFHNDSALFRGRFASRTEYAGSSWDRTSMNPWKDAVYGKFFTLEDLLDDRNWPSKNGTLRSQWPLSHGLANECHLIVLSPREYVCHTIAFKALPEILHELREILDILTHFDVVASDVKNLGLELEQKLKLTH